MIELQFEDQPLFHRAQAVLHPQAVHQPAQAEWLASRVEFAGLQFGHGKDVVDQAHHVPRRAGGGTLVLLQLLVQRQRLHQLKGTDDAIHRRAQLVGDRGEEFVLQAVAVGQFLVERLQLASGVLEDARALFLHGIDAVGQGEGQQPHFQCRTNLAGVHGEEDVGQIAQHHQGVEGAADKEGAPGDDEITRHAHAAQPGQHASGEDHHGKDQRQRSGQPQGQAVAGRQRQDHCQPAERHQAE